MTHGGFHKWLLLTGRLAAVDAVTAASARAGFSAEPVGADRIHLYVPRSLRKRRRAAEFIGAIAPTRQGTEVCWFSADGGPPNCDSLLAVEENLAEGIVDYGGLIAAAASAGLPRPPVRELRSITELLGRHETVRAVGSGQYEHKEGRVLLTNDRLLFGVASGRAKRPSLDLRLDGLDKVSLGKRRTGEVLRVWTRVGESHEISHLGHGEGYGITRTFWQNRRDIARVDGAGDDR